jgi:DnaJ domain
MRSTSSRRAWRSTRSTRIAPPALTSMAYGSVHHRRKRPSDNGAVKTLYDLLGVHPNDDAETLKGAFRKAVKANHPDLHADDPDAPTRFRRITGAYAILRHAEQRAVYDRLLELERQQQRWNARRIISYVMRNVVFDAIAAACVGLVLAGGYTFFMHVSNRPAAVADVVEVVGRAPAEVAILQTAAPIDANDEDGPRSKPARVEVRDLPTTLGAASSGVIVDHPHDTLARMKMPDTAITPTVLASQTREGPRDTLTHTEVPDIPIAAVMSPTSNSNALEVADSSTGPRSAEPNKKAVTKIVDGGDVSIDQAGAETTADRLRKADSVDSRDQNKAEPPEVRFSSLEKSNAIAKNSSPDLVIPNEKRDVKMPAKPRTVAKRQPQNQVPFTQASLENKSASACPGSPSCSGSVPPPLFGVGF